MKTEHGEKFDCHKGEIADLEQQLKSARSESSSLQKKLTDLEQALLSSES